MCIPLSLWFDMRNVCFLVTALGLLTPAFIGISAPWQTTPAPIQNYRGRVVDIAGHGVAGASVWAKGTHTATSTNADGLFLLSLPAGAYFLLVDYPGHLARETPVPQVPDSALTITLYSTQPHATRRR